MEKKWVDYYRIFEVDHERRRSQLMDSLPQRQSEPMVSDRSVRFLGLSRWPRKAFAAAAVVLIAVGLSFIINIETTPMNPQAAWASAIDHAGQVQSVHLNATTGSSSLEMWWRRPNHFRMKFSNGNIITHNGKSRRNYDLQSNTLVKSRGGSVGFEMFILGELGQVFTSNHHLTEQAMKNSTLISTKDVIYKGEKCQEMTFVKDADAGTLFVSVVDAKENFIYDIKMYNKSHPERVLYHIEVLDVDQMMPDSLFELKSQPGQRVVDRM